MLAGRNWEELGGNGKNWGSMGSEAMSVCGITRGMNLCILRILWLVVQRIIKVEIVSLSPLIISTALICLLSTFHWALKPGWRLFINCSSSA